MSTKTTTTKSSTKKSVTKKSPAKVKTFFGGLETIDEIRIQFLESLEGISAEDAKVMFAEYLKVAKKYGDAHKNAKGKIYKSKPRMSANDWAKMVLALTEIEGLSLSFESPNQDFKGRWLWASGETKKNREVLKSYGFSWCPQQGSLWVLKSA